MGGHFGYLVHDIKQDLEACGARVSVGIFAAMLLTEKIRPKFFECLQHLQFSADHMPTAVNRLSRLYEFQTWLNVKPYIFEWLFPVHQRKTDVQVYLEQFHVKLQHQLVCSTFD